MDDEPSLEDLIVQMRETALTDVEVSACRSRVLRAGRDEAGSGGGDPRRVSHQMKRCCFAAAAVLALATGNAQSQVYRCGNTYSDKPCPDAKVIDAQPNTGMEVRGPNGAVVHSRDGDKARLKRTSEQMNENMHNAIGCAFAGDTAAVKGGRIDCPTMKSQQDAKRLTPDYIKK